MKEKIMKSRPVALVGAFCMMIVSSMLLSGSTGAPDAPTPPSSAPSASTASDSADVSATVNRYHAALASGDSAAALALLSPNVRILESGGVEDLAEYRAHHLPADIAFARAVPATRTPNHVQVRGDVAWSSSTSITQGTFNGRAVNSAGAELMVLERTAQGWKISAIHWSSRTRRP